MVGQGLKPVHDTLIAFSVLPGKQMNQATMEIWIEPLDLEGEEC
jgi:hypothetical protein